MRASALFVTLSVVAGVEATTGQATVTLVGTTLDSATLQPIQAVSVYTTTTVRTDFTDASGAFQLADLPPGMHIVTLRRGGYRTRSFQVTLAHDDRGENDVGWILLSPGQEPTARIGGTVSSSLGAPVERAGVMLNGRLVAYSGTEGRYQVEGVEAGINLLEVRRIGYRPVSIELQIPGDVNTIEVPVTLGIIPLRLAEIVVDAEHTVFVSGLLRDFYRRRQRGFGHYFTRWQIEDRNPIDVTDLLRTVPGVSVVPSGAFSNTIRVHRGSCRGSPDVYVDGMRIFAEDLDIMVLPSDVHGIEVYTGIAGAPIEYSNSQCGVILVWTN